MHTPLVSIIIPTYNRAHLIGETLDSVLAQTYTHWECIVVDDGSTDETAALLKAYCEKDSRFQYHQRPADRLKGANACRNYGFELSNGEYVNWFDDDDLMLEDFINLKINKIIETNLNFVFSKSMNFNSNNEQNSMFEYKNENIEISSENFVTQSLTFCTLDFLAVKRTLDGIYYNEILDSGQEYNFFARYLCKSKNGLFIDEFLSLRRLHERSIQENLKTNRVKYRLDKYLIYILTYEELINFSDKVALNHLLNMAMSKVFEMTSKRENIPHFFKLIKFVFKEKRLLRTVIFCFSLLTSYFFNKGFFLMNYSRNLNS